MLLEMPAQPKLLEHGEIYVYDMNGREPREFGELTLRQVFLLTLQPDSGTQLFLGYAMSYG